MTLYQYLLYPLSKMVLKLSLALLFLCSAYSADAFLGISLNWEWPWSTSGYNKPPAHAPQPTPAASGVSVCYWGTWAYYNQNPSFFDTTNIDVSLCSHILYSFIGLDYDGNLLLLDEYLDIDLGALANFTALSKEHPDVKFMVAMGGYNQGTANYSAVAADSTKRAFLVEQIVDFLNEHELDGFDLDWEYPNKTTDIDSGSTEDYENFVTLLSEIRAAFTAEGKGWVLTAAVAAYQTYIDTSYDVAALSEILDYFFVMTYDMHGTYDGVTGANAPLLPQPSDDPDTILTVSSAIDVWLAAGAPPEKLVMGIGGYGKAYTLADADDNGTGANITGAGLAGPWRGATTTWAYIELCSTLLNETDSWTLVNYYNYYVYAYEDTLWIGYDDPVTTEAKGQFAKEKGIAGIMMWSLENDDFAGYCGEKYGLLRGARRGFGLE